MKELVVDFDDVCLDSPSSNGLNRLFYYKGKYPNFKVNLFTIPNRSTQEWMNELANTGWISVCMHGWNHDTSESITQENLNTWKHSLVYKGPEWKVTQEEIDLLQKNYFSLAVIEKIDNPISQWPLSDKRCLHGHIWIKNDLRRIEKHFEEDSTFHFIEEVI